MPVSRWAKPRPAAGAAARGGDPATISAGAAKSLMSDRHAHDVLVGGQKLVPDLESRLEPDGRGLARQHDGGDVGDLALLVGLADLGRLRLKLVRLRERALQHVGEARRCGLAVDRADAGRRAEAGGSLERVVLLQDGGAHREQAAAVDAGHRAVAPAAGAILPDAAFAIVTEHPPGCSWGARPLTVLPARPVPSRRIPRERASARLRT